MRCLATGLCLFLAACSSGSSAPPPGGPGAPAALSVTAFRDGAAQRITDLVGLMDRVEAILTGSGNPAALQALGIALTPAAGTPNAFDFQAAFDVNADGVDDAFSGRIAFSADPAQLGPGATAQLGWSHTDGAGDVSSSGDLDLAFTGDGVDVSGTGSFTSVSDGATVDFLIDASDPLPIRFATPAAATLTEGLRAEALTLGGVEIAGTMHVSVTIGSVTFEADLEFTVGSNVVQYTNATLDGQPVPDGQFLIFAPGLPQAEILAMLDAMVVKMSIVGTILEKSWEIGKAVTDPAALPPNVTLFPPNPDLSVPFELRLGDFPSSIPAVGTLTNVRVTGTVVLQNNEMFWEITDDGGRIDGSNTSGIPILFDAAAASVFNTDGHVTLLDAQGNRICTYLFSNGNLTFGPGGVDGSITRIGIIFHGADQAGIADDSGLSASLVFAGGSVEVALLSAFLYDPVGMQSVNLLTHNPPLPRNFSLDLP